MSRYNVNAVWDDPFEHMKERRRARRFRIMLRISLTAENAQTGHRMVGPCVVQDISLTGLCAVTKHKLTLGQTVSLAIPTAKCPLSMCLPAEFQGVARVIRIAPIDTGRSVVALQFGDAFQNDMDFAMFIDFLESIARVMI